MFDDPALPKKCPAMAQSATDALAFPALSPVPFDVDFLDGRRGARVDKWIADAICSATTLRRRRDAWIVADIMPRLQEIVRAACGPMIGVIGQSP